MWGRDLMGLERKMMSEAAGAFLWFNRTGFAALARLKRLLPLRCKLIIWVYCKLVNRSTETQPQGPSSGWYMGMGRWRRFLCFSSQLEHLPKGIDHVHPLMKLALVFATLHKSSFTFLYRLMNYALTVHASEAASYLLKLWWLKNKAVPPTHHPSLVPFQSFTQVTSP